jgi:hypothetical protein
LPPSFFTPDSAWEFIREALISNCDIEIKPLDMPPGATGYVLLLQGEGETIYVKLQLGSNNVIGRSFHISKYQKSMKTSLQR